MPKVWGIGLHRTGTTSLHQALSLLGYRTIHYPRYMWLAERFDAACDLPVPVHYAELARKYPTSKFVLTVRDKDAWVRSVLRHRQRFPWGATLTPRPVRRSLLQLFGGRDDDPEQLSRGWDAHVAGVLAYFKDEPDRLLALDICAGEGWEKLCPFLAHARPASPFPATNNGIEKVRSVRVGT